MITKIVENEELIRRDICRERKDNRICTCDCSLRGDAADDLVNAKAADTGKHLDVLFTHDTHSHLNSFSTIVDGKQEEVGGFARLKT